MEILKQLGLGWQDILFHAINLIILVVALYFILYKPVKKMVANHKAKLDDVFKENQKLNAEAHEIKHKNDQILAQVKQEAAKVTEDAIIKAEERSVQVIADAKQKANNILETAKKEAIAEKQRLKTDFRESTSKLAIDIAEKLLEREVTEKDNALIIDKCLSDWDKK